MDGPLSFQDVARAIAAHPFRFAKSMPHIPHWYTLRKEWPDDRLFTAVVDHIRRNGYPEAFGDRWFIKWNLNGFKYWTMGWPASESTVLNRAEIDAPQPYDEAAEVYDAMWSKPADKALDLAMVRAACGYREDEPLLGYGGDVLDIGCGSGLFLDHVRPAGYLGIDPSRAMLAALHRKHGPDVETIPTAFESFYTERRFDLVVGLFGAPGYIRPEFLVDRLPSLLKPGGRWFLMCFREKYVPLTDKRLGIRLPFYHFQAYRDLRPDQVTEVGNFVVLEGTAP